MAGLVPSAWMWKVVYQPVLVLYQNFFLSTCILARFSYLVILHDYFSLRTIRALILILKNGDRLSELFTVMKGRWETLSSSFSTTVLYGLTYCQ